MAPDLAQTRSQATGRIITSCRARKIAGGPSIGVFWLRSAGPRVGPYAARRIVARGWPNRLWGLFPGACGRLSGLWQLVPAQARSPAERLTGWLSGSLEVSHPQTVPGWQSLVASASGVPWPHRLCSRDLPAGRRCWLGTKRSAVLSRAATVECGGRVCEWIQTGHSPRQAQRW